jgi:hypothetical protein
MLRHDGHVGNNDDDHDENQSATNGAQIINNIQPQQPSATAR